MQRPISNKSFSMKYQNLNQQKNMAFLTPLWSLGKFRWDEDNDEKEVDALSEVVNANIWR
jgi:hypothetical protein